MRITSNSISNQFLDQIRTLSARQNRLQAQAATGQRIEFGEEDPAAMQRVRLLQAESSNLMQFQSNMEMLSDKAAASYGVMRGLKTISDRVSELATMVDGTRSPEDLKIYGIEVGQLIEQATQLVNERHNGDYLFGGTRSDQPPFVISRDDGGRVIKVAYQGNGDIPAVEVSKSAFISAQVPGANTNGVGSHGLITDSRTGADLFSHLIDFQNHLNAGDTVSVETIDRTALGQDEENLIFLIGTNAAIQSRLESGLSLAANRLYSLDRSVSKEASADLAETLVDLNKTQTAYQAALQSSAGIMRLSLLDYLR